MDWSEQPLPGDADVSGAVVVTSGWQCWGQVVVGAVGGLSVGFTTASGGKIAQS